MSDLDFATATAGRATTTQTSASPSPGKATLTDGVAARATTGPPGIGAPAPAPAVPVGDLTPEAARDTIWTASGLLLRYGHQQPRDEVPPQLAKPIDQIARACESTKPDPTGRRLLLDAGVAGLADAKRMVKPDLAAQFDEYVATVHQALADEMRARGQVGVDPVADLVATRAAVGRAGGIALEMQKLVTFANAKRLNNMRKGVDWKAFGEIVAKNLQLIPDEKGELAEAFGALEGASFEIGFRLLDAVLTIGAAGDTLGGKKPDGSDPEKQARDQAKRAKAVMDASVAVLNGCMQVGRAVAIATVEVTSGEEQKVWQQVVTDLGKMSKLAGGSLSALTAGCDIATNAVILLNGAHGLEAADATMSIAGSTASLLAEGTQVLIEAGVFVEAPVAAATAAELVALATPIAVIIPLAWLATKVVLLELGKLRIGITGAFLAQTFDRLIANTETLGREAEALGAALAASLDPAADQAAVTGSVGMRAQLVKERAEAITIDLANTRAQFLRAEVFRVTDATRISRLTDPGQVAVAARAIVTGVVAILDRAPEIVAAEAGDPDMVDKIRRGGAPAPQPGGALPDGRDGSRPEP